MRGLLARRKKQRSAPTAGGLYAARAELVLAAPARRPLATMPLDPDPLQMVAAAMSYVRAVEGEDAEVAIDLLPVGEDRVARRRGRLMRWAERRGPAAFGERLGTGGTRWEGLLDGLGGPARGGRPARRIPRSVDLADGVGKFRPGVEVFAVQVLVRTLARHPGQARVRLHQMLAALDAGRDENWWRALGGRGPWRPYSNVWWRRRGFDRRWRTGEFSPLRRRQWVTVPEIAGWLKPPTTACEATNVRRCGGVVPSAPEKLPTWTGQRGVVPLGMVTGADGTSRLGAVPARDVLFSASYGRSGFGKTELALLEAITMAYGGDGAWFLDPHGAALARARPYLAHPAINSRLWEVDLSAARRTDRLAGHNPLSMEQRSLDDVPVVIGQVVGAISAAQGWGDSAPRAYSILSHAVQALTQVSWRLCEDGRPDLQPTLFQIPTLLLDEDWRELVLGQLTGQQQRWWRQVFPRYSTDSVPVVTQLMDRLETSPGCRAFFGSPRSAYSAREAMDTRRVVLLRPTGTGGADRLATSLLMFDLFAAGLGREGMDPSGLATVWAFVDELTAVDGASRGAIAAILEQLRKYEVRFNALTQMALRLSEETRSALMQNASLLAASGADADEAAFIAKRLPGIRPETLLRAPKYEYVMTTMLHGQRTQPFRVRGVPIDQVLADYYNPDGLAEQQRAVDAGMGRRTVADILGDLDVLDAAILDHLATRATRRAPASPGGVVHRMRKASA